jgi:hypothetical protein
MKKNTIYILVGIITFLNFSWVANAAFDCATVQQSGVSGLYVVLEEPLITEKDDNNILCFRVCEFKQKGTNDKGYRVCTYQESCPGTAVLTLDKEEQLPTCQRIQIMKASSGTELIYNYVGFIYKWAAGTVGIISVFIMVFGGIQIMTSGGDSAKIDAAKKHITQSLSGLVILFLSGLILYTINPTFFV